MGGRGQDERERKGREGKTREEKTREKKRREGKRGEEEGREEKIGGGEGRLGKRRKRKRKRDGVFFHNSFFHYFAAGMRAVFFCEKLRGVVGGNGLDGRGDKMGQSNFPCFWITR